MAVICRFCGDERNWVQRISYITVLGKFDLSVADNDPPTGEDWDECYEILTEDSSDIEAKEITTGGIEWECPSCGERQTRYQDLFKDPDEPDGEESDLTPGQIDRLARLKRKGLA